MFSPNDTLHSKQTIIKQKKTLNNSQLCINPRIPFVYPNTGWSDEATKRRNEKRRCISPTVMYWSWKMKVPLRPLGSPMWVRWSRKAAIRIFRVPTVSITRSGNTNCDSYHPCANLWQIQMTAIMESVSRQWIIKHIFLKIFLLWLHFIFFQR